MKLTKFEHACFSVELENQNLLVDPGNLTSDFVIPENLLAVVITHMHDDHCDVSKIQQIVAKFPDIKIFCTDDTAAKLKLANTIIVTDQPRQMVGPFELDFFSGQHAMIHSSIGSIQNCGVLINQKIFYGGDALEAPSLPVDTLLIPAAAPWMQIGQAIDYLNQVKPRLAIPTHDAIYAPSGKQIADRLLSNASPLIGSKYSRLDGPITIK